VFGKRKKKEPRYILDLEARPGTGPRYGYGRPPHAALRELIARYDDTYRAELERIATYADDLKRIPVRTDEHREARWLSQWILSLDGASLYTYLRSMAPKRYVEVGSGISTTWAARAKTDGALGTQLISIDNHPRGSIDRLCDTVIRNRLEEVDQSLFTSLEAGDILFFDGSHRVFTGSDATVFFLEILPTLRPGVLVGIHDILWPDDYLPEWEKYYFSEQYLFAAYLLAGCPWIRPVLACNYAANHSELRKVLAPLFSDPALEEVPQLGYAFWLEILEH
jgi:hypothetical protein